MVSGLALGGGLGRPMIRILLVAVALAAGCTPEGGGTDTEPVASTAGGSEEPMDLGPSAAWPAVMVIGPHASPEAPEPGLFTGPGRTGDAFGYLNPGTRVRIDDPDGQGRVQVTVGGALSVKGWVPVNRLGLYSQRRGRIPETRAYVGPNDLVTLVEPAAEGEMAQIEVRPWLGGRDYLPPIRGPWPAEALASQPVDLTTVEGPSEGDCYFLPERMEAPVYERPDGQIIATVPAMNPPPAVTVLRERDGWYGVRIGYGPYLTGYVRGALTRCQGPMPTPAPRVPAGGGGRPYWVTAEATGALHRVEAGTRIRFHDEVVGRLRTEGWAREQQRLDDGMVDVFVTIDDQVAIRGLVPEAALTLVEEAPAGSSGGDSVL